MTVLNGQLPVYKSSSQSTNMYSFRVLKQDSNKKHSKKDSQAY